MILLCTKDVVMNDGSIAFKAGERYEFNMHGNGEISRFNNNCLHKFMCYGPSRWVNFFKAEVVS